MKRILNLSVLFSLLFVGCQDEKLAENKPINATTRSVEIVAEMNGESYSRTHTERDESDTKNLYKWDKADQLSVFMGDATEVSCFKIAKLSDDGRTAAFRGDIIIWGGAEDDGIPHLPNVAFYPYSENLKSVSYKKEDASFSLTTNLPSTQMWGGSGTFATNTAPMIAVTEDASSYTFRFKAIAAVSQLHLKAAAGYDATKIVKAVMTVDGYPMAGTYTVTSTFDGVKSVVAAEDAVSSVSMENTEGVELDTDKKVILTFVHFPLPAGDKVVTFDLYDSEGNYMTHTLNTANAFTAEKFMHAGRTNPIVFSPTGHTFVAKVNGQGYETVGEAIASVENNGTATISLVAGEYTLPEVKGKTITFEPAVEGELVKINVAEAAHIDTKYEGSTLNFKNVTLVGTKYAGNTQGYQKATAENYNNCTFENYYMFAGDDVTVTDCTFKGVEGQYFWTGSASNVTFTRCKFNGVDRALKVLSVGNPQDETRNVTFNECEFTASKSNKAVLEFDSPNATSNYKVVLNNSTKSDVFPAWFSDKSSTDSKYLVVINGAYYVSSANDLAGCLTSSEEDIKVVLCADIDVPITSLGNQTPGSGEYKLGGENTNKITIDLNQKKLNITTTYWSGIGAKNDNATITIKNGTMTSSQTSGTWNSYDLTLANCNYVIEDVDFEKSIALTNTGKKVQMKNVDIVETHDYYAIWISAEGQDVTIDGGTITSSGRGVKIDEQYVDTPQRVTLSVKDYTFKTAKKGAILVKSAQGANITLDNVDIFNVAGDTEYAVWCDEDAAQYANSITVAGGKLKVEGTIPVADGVLINKDGVYELSSLAGLKWFANKVNTGESFAGKTVTLTADINLNSVEWSPIGGSDSYTNNFAGTFDGNGMTISNLNVNNNKCAGLFGTMTSGTIKNLTIDGANLNSNHYAGAIVAWMEQGGKSFTMDNCHVKNATIKLTPDSTEGAYDNGDKAGALAGFMHVGTITNCSAENVDITAYRDLGGIIGYANKSTITNNQVNGAKLTIDQVTNYYGDKTANVGQIIGRRGEAPTESGNTYSNVTIDTKTAQQGNFNKVVVGGEF